MQWRARVEAPAVQPAIYEPAKRYSSIETDVWIPALQAAIIAAAWAILAALAAAAVAMLAQADATRQVAEVAQVQAKTNAGLSAAASLTSFLLGLIVALVLGAVGAICAARWWAHRQRRGRQREVLEAAELYAILGGGQRQPAHRQTQPYYSAQALGGGPVIVLPAAGQKTQTPGITLDDLARALQATQGREPLDDLLPPLDGWEV